MVKEYEYIMKNLAWDVVTRSKDESMLTLKWIFKVKHGIDGSIEKYKARFMDRRFS